MDIVFIGISTTTKMKLRRDKYHHVYLQPQHPLILEQFVYWCMENYERMMEI